MRYSEICPAPKITVRHRTAVSMLEDASALECLIEAGWLKPCRVAPGGMRLFSVDDIRAAVARAAKEGWPDNDSQEEAA